MLACHSGTCCTLERWNDGIVAPARPALRARTARESPGISGEMPASARCALRARWCSVSRTVVTTASCISGTTPAM